MKNDTASKIKILWLVNISLPEASKLMEEKISPYGGWLVTASQKIKEHKDLEIEIAFPRREKKSGLILTGDRVNYYTFNPIRDNDFSKIENNTELTDIVLRVKPDLVHIFGTELSHCLAMINICEKLEIKYVISIQGLVSIIENHVLADLPLRVIYGFTLRNIILKDNVIGLKRLYHRRGINEIKSITKAEHVIGRTTWDRACTEQINKKVQYHLCNETLRDIFYEKQWNINEYEPYSIFLSQGQTSLKGLHYVLEAMPIVLKEFPSAKLYVGGKNIISSSTFKDKFLITYYGRYIKKLIYKNILSDKVFFTGELNEEDMCDRLQRSNVFVSSSSIENSPNSLAEAMILGVPCVASDVGGVSDMITHKKDGLIYHSSASYMLAHYICEIFRSKELALKLSKNARRRALVTHDPEINSQKMIEIYKNIINSR